jgi:ABC-type transport system involved in multi-copper enzyme maturation permease subunit
MNRVLAIARADARRAVRSRLVWSAIVLLGAMFLPSTGTSARPDLYSISEYLLLLPFDLMTFSLVVVAAVGYNAVVGERVSGTVRFVLGLPATRRDLVLGKLLSRMGLAVVALGVILVIANALVFQGYGRPHFLAFWVMGGWMLVYVAVWSAVTIGYSAAFNSPYRTIGALIVTYVVFSFNFGVWGVLVRPAFALAFTGSFDAPSYETLADAPLWLRVTERLNPLVDFWQATRWSIEFVGPGTPTGGPVPHLLGTLVFLSFGAIPLVIGLRRFDRTDFGDGTDGFRLGNTLWRRLRGVRAILPGNGTGIADSRTVRVRLLAIADVRHALQNWVISGALLFFLLLVGPRLWTWIDLDSISTRAGVLSGIPTPFVLPILVVGIAVGHNAITGERTARTVRMALSLPTTRREFLLAKLCSRVGVIVGILVPLLLFAEGLVIARLGGVYPGAFVAWAGWILLSAAVWTAVAVGASAAVSSRFRSLGVVFGTYLIFSRRVGLWDPVVRPLFVFVFNGRSSAKDYATAADSPAWFTYLDHLNPFVALDTLRDGFFMATGYGTRYTDATLPLFVYSVAVLLLFVVGALTIGTRRFGQSTLT